MNQNFIWDEIHKKNMPDSIIYDDWLDSYLSQIIESYDDTPIIDLGCGLGNDTLYLLEKGFKVISCDKSKVALEYIQSQINNTQTLKVDIKKKLPFGDSKISVLIADLSLHYFSDEETKNIMREIKRVLKPSGILISRVNSIDDFNYGALSENILENHYYLFDGYKKRFFDEQDIVKYFSIVGNTNYKSTTMLRYKMPKIVYEVVTRKL